MNRKVGWTMKKCSLYVRRSAGRDPHAPKKVGERGIERRLAGDSDACCGR